VPFPSRIPSLKICGVTRADEAERLADLGVDALGVNFWHGSKRFTDPSSVAWLAPLAGRIVRVGVFVNADPALPLRLFATGLIDAAQLHGEEAADIALPLRAAGLTVIKAGGVASRLDLERLLGWGADALLADAPAPGTYGGTGRVLDWNLVREFRLLHPEPHLILAGGITPDNAAQALAIARPAALDVASGAELRPGLKDFAKVEALLAITRSAPSAP
jgi:phosphoribosylanthranilate isomerase